MPNPVHNLSKGLFKAKMFVKDVRSQFNLIMIVFFSAFSVYCYQLYDLLNEFEQAYLLTNLKIYFMNWIGYNSQFIDTYFLAVQVERFNANIYIPAIIATIIWLGITKLFYKFGKNKTEYKIAEGFDLIQPDEFQKKLSHKKSNLKVANVNWYQNAEVQHLLIVGDPGTGKSQVMNQLLMQIRKNGDTAILYDVKGDYIRDFYKPNLDKILSPFDSRSETWDPWLDLTSSLQIETFAEAIIKENNQDAFWSKAARMVLVATLKKGKSLNWTFNKTIRFVTTNNLDVLTKWFDNTEVASDFSNEKTAASVLSELKTQIRSLNYLPEINSNTENYSLNKWLRSQLNTPLENVKNTKKTSGWLFLPISEELKVTGAPILAALLELLSKQILSLPTNRHRRIWIIIDELPSLPKLNSIRDLLAQGRGYGVAAVLATQNLSQLKEIYGNYGTNALTSLCSSLLSLRVSDPETAKYLSERIGKHLRIEVQNTQSHSKNKAGKSESDGLSEQTIERAAVSASFIMKLDDLRGVFVSKGIPNPVAIKVKISKLSELNEGFMPAYDLETRGTATQNSDSNSSKWDV